jgi:hypothetical protein
MDDPATAAEPTPGGMPAEERQRLIDREIRIQQSIEIQRFNPSIVVGNIVMALIFLGLDPRLVIESGAIFALLPLAAVIALGMLS